jgi:hypothetical protein
MKQSTVMHEKGGQAKPSRASRSTSLQRGHKVEHKAAGAKDNTPKKEVKMLESKSFLMVHGTRGLS